MRIADILSEELIIPQLEAETRDDVLAELVDRICANHPDVDRDRTLRSLIDRERVGSTGIGDGVAVPHAKLPAIQHAIACFARSEGGVDFRAIDGKKTHLFLALLAPDGGVHLKALARASLLLRDADLRQRLLSSEDAAAMWTVIQEKDKALPTG